MMVHKGEPPNIRPVAAAQLYGHLHAEAFCLMKYSTKDGSEAEWIWNSRDGVTPFIIRSRSGKEMTHVDWHLDRYLPNYKPAPGERIFVDLTLPKAIAYARARIERDWDHPQWPASRMWSDKNAAINELAASMLEPKGQPDLIEARELAEAGG